MVLKQSSSTSPSPVFSALPKYHGPLTATTLEWLLSLPWGQGGIPGKGTDFYGRIQSPSISFILKSILTPLIKSTQCSLPFKISSKPTQKNFSVFPVVGKLFPITEERVLLYFLPLPSQSIIYSKDWQFMAHLLDLAHKAIWSGLCSWGFSSEGSSAAVTFLCLSRENQWQHLGSTSCPPASDIKWVTQAHMVPNVDLHNQNTSLVLLIISFCRLLDSEERVSGQWMNECFSLSDLLGDNIVTLWHQNNSNLWNNNPFVNNHDTASSHNTPKSKEADWLGKMWCNSFFSKNVIKKSCEVFYHELLLFFYQYHILINNFKTRGVYTHELGWGGVN